MYTYSPNTCTPLNYLFTFIFDKKTETFKVHGIWVEGCEECPECSYPVCCDIDNAFYEYPFDPSNFIKTYWFNTTTKEECNNINEVILFEHEYWKHITCSNMKNTTEFLNTTMDLYNKYYDKYVKGSCNEHNELWLYLDKNYEYQKLVCK